MHYFRFHVSVILHGMCLSLSDLTSFSMIISRSIHVTENVIILFFMMAGKYSIVCMHYIFCIQLSVDSHLGFFHVLAIVDDATLNRGVHVSS